MTTAGRHLRKSGGGPPSSRPGRPRRRVRAPTSTSSPAQCGAGRATPVFRERAGFPSNAQVGSARSTGNLRVRGDMSLSAVAIPAELPPATARGRGAVRKGGSRISFTPHSMTASSRNGGMTPFLERPDPPRALKSTQEPPFPPRQRAGGDSRCVEYPGEVLSGSAAESVGERVHPGRARESR